MQSIEFCIDVVETLVVSGMAPVISELKEHNMMITNVYARSLNLVLCGEKKMDVLFVHC